VVGEPTDAEVIAASLVDGREFSLVYERYFDDIFRYVAKRIGAEAAGDVAADVFIAAFEKRERYDTSRSMCRPWLYGIASNLVRDHLRRQKRRGRAYLRAAVIDAGDDQSMGDAEARAAAALMVPEINAALGKLNAGDREVLLLFALADLSYEDIAEALDIPIGTVRSRLSRARKRMQELVPTD
jgi:RNA polymerase sigma factor (sigma-70 family)